MPNETVKLYTTRDLYLASTLLSTGFSLESVDFQYEGSRNYPVGYFNFVESEELLLAEQRYLAGKMQVEPKQFVSNMRVLKSQLSTINKSPRKDLEGTRWMGLPR